VTTFRELTVAERSLADALDRYTGAVDDGGRAYDDSDDDLSEEERELAEQFEAFMRKPPSGEDEAAAERAFLRNYTGLGAEGVSLALRLDSLTGLRP
jgi:hypothetical protein